MSDPPLAQAHREAADDAALRGALLCSSRRSRRDERSLQIAQATHLPFWEGMVGDESRYSKRIGRSPRSRYYAQIVQATLRTITHRVINKSELRRLNLEILSGPIVDSVTRITALCSKWTGDNVSWTRYVSQNGIVFPGTTRRTDWVYLRGVASSYKMYTRISTRPDTSTGRPARHRAHTTTVNYTWATCEPGRGADSCATSLV
jgi:hypothetical protein